MSADALPALRPRCEAAPCGVFLDLRAGFNPNLGGNGHTPEQQWCGVWYDHPPVRYGSLTGHTTSVLIPSPALVATQIAAASDGEGER